MKNWDNANDTKISKSVSNIIMLQNYMRNDKNQSQVSDKKILEPWRIKSVGHLGYYTMKFMI